MDALYGGGDCPLGSCSVTAGVRIQVEPAATTSGIGFALARGGAIEGVVADAGDGRPLGGIAVHVFVRESGRALGAVRTNGSGFYSCTGLPAGTYAVATSNTRGLRGPAP